MPQPAFINRIATAVPENEVHRFFLGFANSQLRDDPRQQAVFNRLADKGGIERRYSHIRPTGDPEGPTIDVEGVFRRGGFPGTARRMAMFEAHAPNLAVAAVERLGLGSELASVTHLVVASCTGFSAPGIDLEIVARCGLSTSVERTMVGFMGCYAAINALKLARHIVRSEPAARVLVVNVELCTLHLQETTDLEKLLSFCLWGDGCAAALVSAEPSGLRIDGFHATVAADTRELMSWTVTDDGFDMVLSGRVPGAIAEVLKNGGDRMLGIGVPLGEVDLWAVHPGGRSVLDAVERVLNLSPAALGHSRAVLRDNGNMSSATVMFVLKEMLGEAPDQVGCAMAFGPGLTAETMTFRTVG